MSLFDVSGHRGSENSMFLSFGVSDTKTILFYLLKCKDTIFLCFMEQEMNHGIIKFARKDD